jgi:hypothetical protein
MLVETSSMKTNQLVPGHIYRLTPQEGECPETGGFRIFVLAVDGTPQPRRARLVYADVLLANGKIEIRCSVNPAQWEFVV